MITPSSLAARIGWGDRRTRRRLLSTGAGLRVGRRIVVTMASLVEHWPEAAHALAPIECPGPAMLEASDVARMLGWETRRARRWMLREGVAEKRGGRWVTTPQRLVAEFGRR